MATVRLSSQDSFWLGVGFWACVAFLRRLVPTLIAFGEVEIPISAFKAIGIAAALVVVLVSFGLFVRFGGHTTTRGKIAATVGAAACVAWTANYVVSARIPLSAAAIDLVPAVLMAGVGYKRMAGGYLAGLAAWYLVVVLALPALARSLGVA